MFVPSALAIAAALWIAYLVALAVEKRIFDQAIRRWKSLSKLGKCVVALVLIGFVAFAGTKPSPGDGGGADGGDDPAITNVVEGAEGDATNLVGGVDGEANTNDIGGALMLGMFGGAPNLGDGETGGEAGESEPEAPTNAPASRISRIAPSAYAAGFVLQRIGTDETFDFSAPEGAFVATNWVRHGAATARIHADLPDWTFPFGDGYVTNLAAFANGVVMPDVADTNRCFSPFSAPLGIVPTANWSQLPANGNQTIEQSEQANNSPSVFWWTMTDRNSIVCTWQNVLLDRMPTNPVSFQVEFRPGGSFVYRYDLSRLASDDLLTNVTVGVKNGDGEWFAPTVRRSLTSLTFQRVTTADIDNPDRDGDGIPTEVEMFDLGTDPDNADTDFDGLPDGKEIEAGLDPCNRDSDGDGLVDASDPDPQTVNADVDDDRDGINDDYERHWFGDTNVVDDAVSPKEDGFTLGMEILAGINPTNAAPSPVTYITNSLVSWKMVDAFAAALPQGASSLVWERTFNISKTTPWHQCFVSAAPDSAAGWMLEGMRLEWQDSNGNSGSVARSPSGDSWRIPLSTNETSMVTLRLRANGNPVRTATPLYLIAYVPEFKMQSGTEITGTDGTLYSVYMDGSKSVMPLEIDWKKRPCRTAVGPDEYDMCVFERMAEETGDFVFEGDWQGGMIYAHRPGIYQFPDITAKMSLPVRARRLLGGPGGGGHQVVILDPSVGWTCNGDGCGWGGLGYDWEGDWYYEESDYPLDSSCLRSKWHYGYGGGWSCNGEFYCSSGIGDGGGVSTSTDGNRGTVSVGGVEVWSDSAEHIHDHYCGGGDSLESEGCCGDCRNGNCASTEGGEAGSLKFRIPLGSPADGFVSGFAYFDTEDPITITKSVFQLKMHPDADYSDTTENGVRSIVCNDQRGRTLLIESIAGGVRITIRMTATGSLEHTWEITNVGSSSVIRLRKISRLDNVMEDETYRCEDGDWVRFDNIAQIREEVTKEGGVNDADWGGVKRETHTTYDADGNCLSQVVTETRRFGECDNAVLRETFREEYTGCNYRQTWADYWDDPQHPRRHGKMRLRYGNDAPWQYADYDEYGRETIRVEQRNGSERPGSFPVAVSNDVGSTEGIADAFVTVFCYAPMDGDDAHIDDAALPRTESKYVVRGGVPTLIGRTWRRYTRHTLGQYDTVKVETWRDASGTAEWNDANNATSYEVTFADSGEEASLAMRGAVVESLDENGLLTGNTYSVSGKTVTCVSRKSYASNAYPTYTVTETDADYGNVLRQATYLTDGDVLLTEEHSTYDDRNRLRSTAYSDGTSLTNSYSCCRLLWKRDREGRKVLRSGVTGYDHLYNADEEVWLADISTNGGYRVTQHFFDALGRETNTLTYVGFTPGEANDCQASNGKVLSSVTTEYPNGGSDLAIRTDERGCVTMTRTDLLPNVIENGEEVQTNGVRVSASKTRTVFGGGSTVRREWGERDWTEESRFTDYAADGRRLEYVVTESPDCGTVTNSVSTYDLLGRVVATETPLGFTTYTYDQSTKRMLSAVYAAGGIERMTEYLYNAYGEQVGDTRDGVVRRSDVTYAEISNVWWKVTTDSTTAQIGTNTQTVTREQLTGLVDGLRSRETTDVKGGAKSATERVFDPVTGLVTETATSSAASPVVTESFCGLETKRTADGETQRQTYDAFGRGVARMRCTPGGGSQTPVDLSVYNSVGDLVESHTFTNGTDTIIERYAYDMLGRRVSTINALGDETRTAYDANGNVIAESGATYPVRYAYDSQNRRVAMWTNRSGDEWDMTHWTYDPATGLCTSKTYSDGSVTTYEYTPDGLLETTRYASGHWVRNLYNQARQIVGTQYDSAANVSYTLDVFGQELTAVNAIAAYSYSRDASGLATNEAVTITDVAHGLSRLADNDGRLIAFDAGGGYAAQTISYRPDGKIAAISTADAVVSYTYGEGGFETGYSLSVVGGATFTRTVIRDPFRRGMILDVQNSIGQGYGYTYDALSRPVTRNADTFAYNFRSEVIGANVAGNGETYDYDNIGNSTFAAFNSVTNIYAANGLNQYVSVASDEEVVEPAYDEDGNMVAYGPWSYAYDSVGRLTTASSNGLVVATNYYDHQGRRVRLVTQSAAHTFIYDGWNVVLELVEHDGVTDRIEYYWGRDLSGSLQGAGGVGGLLYLKINGTVYVPIYDANGNVMEYRTADGSLAAAYVYDSFGRTISQTGSLADAFRFRYSTKSYERETDLYYYGARFYSLKMRRWLGRDPMDELDCANLYLFCGNCALKNFDKLGCSVANYLPFLSTILSAVENFLGHIPGSSVTDYTFVSPCDCQVEPIGAEAECKVKVKKEGMEYVANYIASAAIARGVDFAVAILTHRVNAVVASAFGADGMIGAALNSWAAAKIMEGARRAAQENCNCSQFEK